jgi:hypothetical protein
MDVQPFLVAELRRDADTTVGRKDKLIARLMTRPKDFTWSEACSVMSGSGFKLTNRAGSRRLFTHVESKLKVSMHEPHSRSNLLPYELDLLIDGLKGTGQISND